jgi:hypothetical protein
MKPHADRGAEREAEQKTKAGRLFLGKAEVGEALSRLHATTNATHQTVPEGEKWANDGACAKTRGVSSAFSEPAKESRRGELMNAAVNRAGQRVIPLQPYKWRPRQQTDSIGTSHTVPGRSTPLPRGYSRTKAPNARR